MGWFSIAVIIGFLLFWSWRKHLQGGPARETTSRAAKLSSCLVRLAHYALIEYLPATLAGLIAVAIVLLVLGQYFVSIDGFNIRAREEIRRGYATRFILGLILGFGIGYVFEQRSRAADNGKESGNATARTAKPGPGAEIAPAPAPEATLAPEAANAQRDDSDEPKDEPADSPLSSLARLGTNTLWSIGIGIIILALASPHLDSWLNHITKIKLPYGELTVASSTTHRTINSDALLYLADSLSLNGLSTYNDKIDQDIEYIKFFQIQEMKTDRAIREDSVSSPLK